MRLIKKILDDRNWIIKKIYNFLRLTEMMRWNYRESSTTLNN